MYTIVPALQAKSEDVRHYWMSLVAADTLKYRLCSNLNPGWRDVLGDLKANGKNMYVIYNIQDREIVAEFELFNYNGDSCQIHFSTLPELGLKKIVEVCRFAAKEMLSKWKKQGSIAEVPYLHTIVGMTPTSNRAACITVLKIGYKKLGVIPKSIDIARKGTTEDCMLSILTLELLNEKCNG